MGRSWILIYLLVTSYFGWVMATTSTEANYYDGDFVGRVGVVATWLELDFIR